MLFQIDIKLNWNVQTNTKQFESNVILDRYKTHSSFSAIKSMFESNVILDRYKTFIHYGKIAVQFESNVILDRYKTH